MKERVTLTIERSILEQIDNSIDGSKIKNRSHAVELLLRQAIGIDKPTKGVILAGGDRTLKKDDTPKSLIEVKGKPLIQHNIELFKKYGIKDILISVCYKKEQVKDALGDGKKFGVNLTYIEEKNGLGTAGPLKQAKSQLKETFVMCNADELKEIDLNDMLSFHHANKAMATVALTTVRDVSNYGVALLNGNKIMAFMEKPDKDNAPSKLINAGLYIIEPEVIDFIPEGFSRMEMDVFPKLASEEKLCGYPFGGQWFDIESHKDVKKADIEWRGLNRK